jgi:type VI secretion system protein ImpE
LPLSEVKQLSLQAPRTLRDLLWLPARIELHDKPLGEVFVPTLYFGSSGHADNAVKLGRMTDWKTVGDGTLVGVGQRTFLIDEVERTLLEIREVEFKVDR